jgi:hypothetical protein
MSTTDNRCANCLDKLVQGDCDGILCSWCSEMYPCCTCDQDFPFWTMTNVSITEYYDAYACEICIEENLT